MKKKILFMLPVILILALSSCEGKPVAQFSETTHDFGKVQKSSTFKHTFTFTNRGTSTLIIDRIKAG